MRILFTGGGSGGHIFPLIAVIRELKQIAEENQILDLELFYMGPIEFTKELFADEEVIVIPVVSGKIRRYFSVLNFFDIFRTFFGIIKGVWRMFFIMPDVIFSKGGYGALPVVIAAAIFQVPLIIHESDSVPGRVNRFSARFARRIGIAFIAAEKYFPKEKIALVGVPIRKRLLGGNKEEAKENLGVFSLLPTISFFGASQGSQKINDVVIGALKDLTASYEVLHQTGTTNFNDTKGEGEVVLEFAHKERYHAFGFLRENDLRDFYLLSDLVVSRAGASSVFEIAAWGKPSILIPLRNSAQNHQEQNAYEYAALGACEVLQEENLAPHVLVSEIKKLIDNPEKMHQMGEAAQRFSRIDSARVIAEEILKLSLHQKTKT